MNKNTIIPYDLTGKKKFGFHQYFFNVFERSIAELRRIRSMLSNKTKPNLNNLFYFYISQYYKSKMKNLLLAAIMLLTTTANIFAQSNEIGMIEKGIFNKKVYVKCDIELTELQFVNLFANDEILFEFYKPLVLNYTAHSLLRSAAIFMIFFPVTETIYGNKDPHWNIAIIGAGCAALSIPFKIGFNKHSRRAVNFYNNVYPNSGSINFGFHLSPTRAGIVMNF